MKLSASARLALRSAFTNHPKWNKEFRNSNGYNLANMSVSDYLECARKLGIDASQFVNAKSDTRTNSRAEEAKDVFGSTETNNETDKVNLSHKALRDKLDAMTFERDRDADFANSLVRGFDKYGQFTDRQLPHVHRLIDRANDTRDIKSNSGAGASIHGDDKLARLAKMLADVVTNSITMDDVKTVVRAELENIEFSGGAHTIRLEECGVEIGEIKGAHPKLKTILTMAQCRNGDGFVPGIFLPGPAGSGKTFAVKQVAKALDLPFHFNGSIGMAHELLGFIDANGCYHRTPFRDAYENGGVYLFDEVDGSDNAAILALNAALAGDCATFPDGQVDRHPDFIPMATANTWGMGANADYVGRAKLDGAFLDRFPGRVFWDYDNVLECAISGNQEFAERVQRARSRARELGLKVLITPRASMAGAAYIAGGMTHQEAAEVTYLANLTPDQRAMLGE